MQTRSERSPRWGSRKLSHLCKAEGGGVTRETVRRIRKHEGLPVIQRAPQRRPGGESTTPPTRAASPHHVWRSAFVHAEPPDGRWLQCLTILDASTREGGESSGARSITAADVVQVLRRLCAQRGAPQYVKSDNGPAGIAQRVTTWWQAQPGDPHLIDPGSPWQHGQNERVQGGLREGCLHRWLLTAVQEAKRLIGHWREEDNHERPHGALDGLTPQACAAQCRPQSLREAA